MSEICAFQFRTTTDYPPVTPLFRIPCESMASLAYVQRRLTENVPGSQTVEGRLVVPGQGRYSSAVEEGIANRVPCLTVEQAIAYHANPSQPIPPYAGRVAEYRHDYEDDKPINGVSEIYGGDK